MSKLRVSLVALGFTAILATAAILSLEVALAYGLWPFTLSTRIVAIIALAVEAVVLGLLISNFVRYSLASSGRYPKSPSRIWLTSDLIASVIASLLSAALLILIDKADDSPETILSMPWTHTLIGSSFALGVAFISQISFFGIHYISLQLPEPEHALSLRTDEEDRLSPQFPLRLKSVPYSRTKPTLSQVQLNERGSSEYSSSRPGTSSERSAVETIDSLPGSLSHAPRPTMSKSRLASYISRPGRRSDSLDSDTYRDRNSGADGAEDGHDLWDTISVDPHNRQMVLESSSPGRSRLLETIPASPATSRSPSPRGPGDHEQPKGGPNRSFSTGSRTPQERNLTPQPVLPLESELNIHPLFRSDSPGPLPTATPGTVVVAAPNAGQIITGKTITRMRSGSLSNSLSPLSRRGSYESFGKTPSLRHDRLRSEDVAEEGEMTPPIPEWFLNSGSKTNLAERSSKKS
ncbi:hypothetical protein F5Y17DRAFT_39470 [Xylariaceae sp. FL0594]|nr:hypothetical protein F5Y17DRAFT_39470 [Xylariaceae sp. FL0594]